MDCRVKPGNDASWISAHAAKIDPSHRRAQSIIPLVGLELGNPTLTFVDPERIYSIANGKITSRSKR
jgi:hypothetical protein